MTEKIYSHARWETMVNSSIAEIKKLASLKGGEYAGDEDRLANFRRNGEALGLPMETIWAVYAGKHWDAIQQYCKDVQSGRSRQRVESISGRLDDLIVYALLMKAMVEEKGESSGNSMDDVSSWLEIGKKCWHRPIMEMKYAEENIRMKIEFSNNFRTWCYPTQLEPIP